jgi:hypothetical protein
MNLLREMLPLTEDEIILCGIREATTARIIGLRQRTAQLTSHYGSQENLEKQIGEEGVPGYDHTLYTDLLEWRAVRYELTQLTGCLENA